MKQGIRNGIKLSIVLLAFVLLNSCVILSLTSMGAPKTKRMSTRNIGDPGTHSLIFGAISDGFYGTLSKWPFPASQVEYLQMNPEYPPMLLSSSDGLYLTKNGIYYSRPVPAGGSYKLIKAVYTRSVHQGTEHMNLFYGMAGKAPWDLKAIQPGLNYFGTWLFIDKEEGEPQTIQRFEQKGELRRRSSPSELECLTEILPVFKDTSWQSIIEARIKELQK